MTFAMDSFVKEQVAAAKVKHDELSDFKRRAFDECYAWLDLVAEKYGRTRGGAKGNVTFSSFDGAQQITIRVQETLTFGPELQIAKDLIDECVTGVVGRRKRQPAGHHQRCFPGGQRGPA
ncbi:Protein of uncharacterised function (DUF3164) [Enterobacter asburiae]|uniref:Protein of uncharacterized function (DUF3164) n=1 Tax=Enterobacter asburiae TaxID=61645 RepID=A0A376FEK6_ENTAS|nr:Protein of uncharacterised function (DUF3164) [Enterobacter asburiae]